MPLDPFFLAYAAAAFLAGGLVKGTVGVGLPLVTVPLLSIYLPVVDAIGLMTFPVLGSNLWQALNGRRYGAVIRRFWPMMLTLLAATLVSVSLLTRMDPGTAALALGLIVVAFALTQAFTRGFTLPARAERPAGLAVGAVAGFLGGLSSLFGPPVATFLAALRLPPDSFVTACGILFLTGSVPLYGLLVWEGATTGAELAASALAGLPVLLGVLGGQRLRRRLSQRVFYRVLLAVLALIGLALVQDGLG